MRVFAIYAAVLFICLLMELVFLMQSQTFFFYTSIKQMQTMSKTNGRSYINYT